MPEWSTPPVPRGAALRPRALTNRQGPVRRLRSRSRAWEARVHASSQWRAVRSPEKRGPDPKMLRESRCPRSASASSSCSPAPTSRGCDDAHHLAVVDHGMLRNRRSLIIFAPRLGRVLTAASSGRGHVDSTLHPSVFSPSATARLAVRARGRCPRCGQPCHHHAAPTLLSRCPRRLP